MKLTIVYDNTSRIPHGKPDWGFACVVESGTSRILFDAGGNGAILLYNMTLLDISPQSIDTVFLSHNHFDHIGGLSAFLNENSDVRVISPPSLRGIRHARELIYADQSMQIAENIWTTGELDGVEQSLVVGTGRGGVLVTGCSHADMRLMFAAASEYGSVSAVIGGLHDFDDFELFEEMKMICPTHCTKKGDELRSLYQEIIVNGGVGTVIQFG